MPWVAVDYVPTVEELREIVTAADGVRHPRYRYIPEMGWEKWVEEGGR